MTNRRIALRAAEVGRKTGWFALILLAGLCLPATPGFAQSCPPDCGGGGDPGIPNPGTPDPGTPDPGTPDPGTPDPGTPDPGTPDPGTPDPGTPDPGTPDPGTPDPGTPDPGTPDPGTPDPGTDPSRPRSDYEGGGTTEDTAPASKPASDKQAAAKLAIVAPLPGPLQSSASEILGAITSGAVSIPTYTAFAGAVEAATSLPKPRYSVFVSKKYIIQEVPSICRSLPDNVCQLLTDKKLLNSVTIEMPVIERTITMTLAGS